LRFLPNLTRRKRTGRERAAPNNSERPDHFCEASFFLRGARGLTAVTPDAIQIAQSRQRPVKRAGISGADSRAAVLFRKIGFFLLTGATGAVAQTFEKIGLKRANCGIEQFVMTTLNTG
jgi:hypothetical protein